jgi:5-methylcytosine-specific restriction endonuclease McrA
MISEFNRFFKSKSLASTYKPTLAKCLLDLADYPVDEGSQWVVQKGDIFTVDLHFIAARFLRYYHPLRFKFKLKQEATKKRIAIYNILEEFQEQLGVKSTPSKKVMCSEKFSEIREKTITNGAIRQQVLPKLRNDCNIYTINKGSKSIQIKKEIIDFMRDNKKLLEAALNHMIAEYLEKCNSSPNISTKLEEKISRTTLRKDKFQNMINMQDSCCFYCGNKGESFAQEHFLPWNFLFQTENYNIIAACQKCNSSKNDRLPHGKYLDKIIKRNEILEDLPMGYSEEFMRNMYENCRLEYHGGDKELWQNA